MSEISKRKSNTIVKSFLDCIWDDASFPDIKVQVTQSIQITVVLNTVMKTVVEKVPWSHYINSLKRNNTPWLLCKNKNGLTDWYTLPNSNDLGDCFMPKLFGSSRARYKLKYFIPLHLPLCGDSVEDRILAESTSHKFRNLSSLLKYVRQSELDHRSLTPWSIELFSKFVSFPMQKDLGKLKRILYRQLIRDSPKKNLDFGWGERGTVF